MCRVRLQGYLKSELRYRGYKNKGAHILFQVFENLRCNSVLSEILKHFFFVNLVSIIDIIDFCTELLNTNANIPFLILDF